MESFNTLPYFRRMRRALLVMFLVFLAAAHSAAAGLPGDEPARALDLQHTILADDAVQQQAGEASDKCCMKEWMEESSSQSPCSTDCTYLVVQIEMLFSGFQHRHDRHERGWGTDISCQTLLRPPIV